MPWTDLAGRALQQDDEWLHRLPGLSGPAPNRGERLPSSPIRASRLEQRKLAREHAKERRKRLALLELEEAESAIDSASLGTARGDRN